MNLTFKDVYSFPLKLYSGCKVFTSKDNMAFDFCFMHGIWSDNADEIILDNSAKELILETLNQGKQRIQFENLTHENGFIRCNGKALIVIRGWGYLTGACGLNLSNQHATILQNDFANFIIKTLCPTC